MGPGAARPDLLAAHRERGVAVEGYSPLKHADLDDPVLGEIARRHDVTPAQVVLRWHIEHDIVVIPKSSRPERISRRTSPRWTSPSTATRWPASTRWAG